MNANTFHDEPAGLEVKITALLLGELSSEEAAAMRWAISQDAELAKLHRELKGAVDLMREAIATPVAEVGAQPALTRLSEPRRQELLAHFKTIAPKEFQRVRRRFARLVVPISVAAAIVGFVGGALLLPSLSSRQGKAGSFGGLMVANQASHQERSREIVDRKEYRSYLEPSTGARQHFTNGTLEERNRQAEVQLKNEVSIVNSPAETSQSSAQNEKLQATLDWRSQPAPASIVLPSAPSSDLYIAGNTEALHDKEKAPSAGDAPFSSSGPAAHRFGAEPANTVKGTSSEIALSAQGDARSSGWTETPSADRPSSTSAFRGFYDDNQEQKKVSGSSLVNGTGSLAISSGVTKSESEGNFARRGDFDSLNGRDYTAGSGRFGAAMADAGAFAYWKINDPQTGTPDPSRPAEVPMAGNGNVALGLNQKPLLSQSDELDLRNGAAEGFRLPNTTYEWDKKDRLAFADSGDKWDSRGLVLNNGRLGDAPITINPAELAAGPGDAVLSGGETGGGMGSYSGSGYKDGGLGGGGRGAGVPASPAVQKPGDSVAGLAPSSDLAKRRTEAANMVQDGKLLYETDRLEEAKQKLNKALETDPGNQAAYYYRNLVSERQYGILMNRRDVDSRKRVVDIEKSLANDANKHNQSGDSAIVITDKEPPPTAPTPTPPPPPPAPKPASAAPIPQPEILARENPFSTFSLNVSDVSFRLAAASLDKGQMPDPASIRTEEFINAFDYRDPEAAPGVPIAFNSERAHYPYAHNRDLLRFSIKTAAAGRQAGKALNIVLLLDKSGSMERADRVEIVHEALRVLASQLHPQDRLSVVLFSRNARLWVDGVSGDQAKKVAEDVSGITPEGGTNLEEAMKLAYATAVRHYLADGVNRVVLMTDGAANLGNVQPEVLKQMVDSNRRQGIALDCFGIGWEGFNDELLETLTRNGNGRYGFVNTPEEAANEFAGQLAGALHVAASDVKVQIEFNPARVIAYRQLGYAKHQLTKEQFRDNSVAAAEIAAQEAGNALYVIQVNPEGDGPLATVRVRYREPGTSNYQEHEYPVAYNGDVPAMPQSSPAMRLACTASAFSEMLAANPYAAEVNSGSLLGLLRGVPETCGVDPRPRKLETMISEARSLSGK